MKHNLYLMLLISFTVFSQKLELKKASPFTAVKWRDNQPIVQFEKDWYLFEQLEDLSSKEIVSFCKKQYGQKWKKRFSEDFVEVLHKMNYHPNTKVNLKLTKNDTTKWYVGTFTFENRQSCLIYNKMRAKSSKENIKKISNLQAVQDLEQFKEILQKKSSYAQLSAFDYVKSIENLQKQFKSRKDSITIDELTIAMSKIMSEIGDRHSSVKNIFFDKNDHNTYNLKLPFGIAVSNHKLIAVKRNLENRNYELLNSEFPYVKSIHNISVSKLIAYNYRAKKAPIDAKLTRAAEAIQNFGALLFKNNNSCPKTVIIELTNGKETIQKVVQLTDKSMSYHSFLEIKNYKMIRDIEKKQDFNDLAKLIDNTIGYFKIPKMFNYERVEGLEAFFEGKIREFSNTKALIIDIRNNPGGRRAILQTLAKYIVQPEQSPWVANVAYLRTNNKTNTKTSSMNARYLYRYSSKNFTNDDRKAIDTFNERFSIKSDFNKSKFSSPFYMILKSGRNTYTKPIYILVNEVSFSAASIFTTAFKDLPNVKIVGITTDGSSGNSKDYFLENSKIKIKVSTMLSYQRNGKTLDGIGTEPDIFIPVSKKQILTGEDIQLKKLITLISKSN